jgi:hypothetical protein
MIKVTTCEKLQFMAVCVEEAARHEILGTFAVSVKNFAWNFNRKNLR